MPVMMRFQVPSRAQSLNHKPFPQVNSLASKLIDGKGKFLQDVGLMKLSDFKYTTNYTMGLFLQHKYHLKVMNY
jgi:hypothetical protein